MNLFYASAAVILGYLVGSIPTAIIAGRIVLKDDIRRHGSGNAGATNVFRVLGWKPALIVMLVDVLKGTVAALLVSRIAGNVFSEPIAARILTGTAAILGHIWTVFAGFRGGKGVGTAFGVLVALAPLASLVTLAVWVAVVALSRIVSLASLTAGLVFPVSLILQKRFLSPDIPGLMIGLALVLAALIFVTHRSNIRRLLKGEENRFGSKNKEKGIA